MGILFGKTITSSIIQPHMINKLNHDKVKLLNGAQMTINSTLVFDENIKEKCHKLILVDCFRFPEIIFTMWLPIKSE